MDGWDFVGHPVTDESAKEAIEQLKRQNDILTGIAAGNAGAEFVDAIFDGLLDGQNTSEVFWNWWPLSTGNGATKYQRLERFAKMLAKYTKGKTYTVRFYGDDVSSDYAPRRFVSWALIIRRRPKRASRLQLMIGGSMQKRGRLPMKLRPLWKSE